MIDYKSRIDFRSEISKLPTMPNEEISKLKLWCDERISLIKHQMESAKALTDGECEKSDWWRRTLSYSRKLGHLSQAIQEQRGLRKLATKDHADTQFLACVKRAMRAVLSPEQYDKILATAIEIQKTEATP